MNKCPICRNIFLEKTLRGYWKSNLRYTGIIRRDNVKRGEKLNTKEYRGQMLAIRIYVNNVKFYL